MDSRTLKDRAHRLFAAGRFAKAAEVYARLCTESPADATLRLRHAESARRANQAQVAVGSYRTAARLLLHDGQAAKARASLRRALELAPSHPEIERALASLEPARTDSIADAIAEVLDAPEPVADIDIEVSEPQPLVHDVLAMPQPVSPSM